MKFKEDFVNLIKMDIKTETRVPGGCAYKVGEVVQARVKDGEPPFALLEVKGMKQERLDDISIISVMKEGLSFKEAFVMFWKEIYGDYDPDLMVCVVSFKLVKVF